MLLSAVTLRVAPSPAVDPRCAVVVAQPLLAIMQAADPAAVATRNGVDYRGGRVKASVFLARRDGDAAAAWADVARRHDLQIDVIWNYASDVWMPPARLCDLAGDPRVASVKLIPRPRFDAG